MDDEQSKAVLFLLLIAFAIGLALGFAIGSPKIKVEVHYPQDQTEVTADVQRQGLTATNCNSERK